jgi:predicted aspartyl protease
VRVYKVVSVWTLRCCDPIQPRDNSSGKMMVKRWKVDMGDSYWLVINKTVLNVKTISLILVTPTESFFFVDKKIVKIEKYETVAFELNKVVNKKLIIIKTVRQIDQIEINNIQHAV